MKFIHGWLIIYSLTVLLNQKRLLKEKNVWSLKLPTHIRKKAHPTPCPSHNLPALVNLVAQSKTKDVKKSRLYIFPAEENSSCSLISFVKVGLLS